MPGLIAPVVGCAGGLRSPSIDSLRQRVRIADLGFVSLQSWGMPLEHYVDCAREPGSVFASRCVYKLCNIGGVPPRREVQDSKFF